MPQSLARNLVHVVFSTKNREPVLGSDVRDELSRYMAGILGSLESRALAVRAMSDHVHILLDLSRNHALARVVMEVKRGSSKWLKTKGARFREFHWQNGYGAFSVSPSKVDEVVRYIDGQEEHHRAGTFQEEFRAFLRRSGIPFDERYVWH